MTSPREDKIKRIGRYYLFYGANEYMLKQKLSSLIKTVIPPGGEAFDLDRFNGKRCEMADLLNSVCTPPAVSPLRVAILENVEKLPARALGMLCHALPKIPEYSVLAMTAEKADRRLKLFKMLLSGDKVAYEFNEFSHSEAANLATKFAADRGKRIDPHLVEALVGIYGTEPYRLENEIEKLALLSGEKGEIEKKDLAFASGYSRVETAYDLPELAFDGKIKEALELCGRAITSGISEIQILYILKNHLERLNSACNLRDFQELIATYRIPYKAAARIFAQSRKVKPAAILSCLSYIFRAEYALKSARFPARSVIELLVVAIYRAASGNKGRE